MTLSSSSKVVLITGSARRIGAAIARYLHQHNINVLLHYRASKAEASQLAEELNSKRANSAFALYADLTCFEELSPFIAKAHAQFGRLDGLVNNASQFYATPMGMITETQWNELIDSNLKSPLFLSQAAMPFLKQQQGCIVNIVDIHAERPMKNYPVYCIAKAGLAMLTKTLARELGPAIRVNGVSPGAIAWPEGVNSMDDKTKEKIVENTILKRCGSPEDIATAVYFFINEADYVTGQILNVDGGRSVVIN